MDIINPNANLLAEHVNNQIRHQYNNINNIIDDIRNQHPNIHNINIPNYIINNNMINNINIVDQNELRHILQYFVNNHINNNIVHEPQQDDVHEHQYNNVVHEVVLPDDYEEERVVPQCSICMHNRCTNVLIPCGHVCTCTQCGERIDRCPICREPFERRQALFFV